MPYAVQEYLAVTPLPLPPSRLEATAHTGAAGGGARAGAIGLGFRAGAHLVKRRLARRLALRPFRWAFPAWSMGQALVVERDAHLVERGLVHLAAPSVATSLHPTT